MSEHKLPKRKRQTPAFVFFRRHDIELEGFTLAGDLIVDLPASSPDGQLVTAIMKQLIDAVESGRMPENAVIYGWHGDSRPPDAVDTDNEEVMAAWAEDRLHICVRLDSSLPDGVLRIRERDFDTTH
jgi:hypothetical protein